MKLFMVIWSIIAITVIILIGVSTTEDVIYQGTIITFKTESHDVEIQASAKIEIEGVSGYYFQLKKSDEILYSTPKAAPLGYEGNNYFVLEKQSISEGNWDVRQSESIDVKLISNENMIITCTHNDKSSVWILSILLGILVWAMVSGIVFAITEEL